MGDFSVKILLCKEKIVFKNQLIKSNHRVIWKDFVDTNGAPVFAPDYRAIVLMAKMSNLYKLDFYVLFRRMF